MQNTPDQWKALFAEHIASGKSAAAFCRERGIDEKRFFYRRKKLSSGKEFSALKPTAAQPLTIELEGGLKLQVAVDQLQAVLDVLCD